MSASPDDRSTESINQSVRTAIHNRDEEPLYDLVRSWGFPETYLGRGVKGVPWKQKVHRERKHGEDGYAEWVEERFGHRHAPLLAAAAGPSYEAEARDSIDALDRALDTMETRATIDEGIVGAATPIEIDPMIVDIQRSAAPVLDRITHEAQAGFTASYNVIDSRNDPVGFKSESEVVDLSQEGTGDFGITNTDKDMKIWVDQVEISDFSQRAEESLNYMDLTETTLGQRTKEHALQKARAIFYGDPSVGETNGSVEDSNAYEGLAKIATDASTSTVDNKLDKSSVSSGFLEDIKAEVRNLVANTGTNYDDLEIFVSSDMFDALENSANTVVRLSGYDEDIDFGRRQISIAGVPVREEPNIRSYSDENTTNFTSDPGDVFVVDTRTVRFRQLAPLSTVPLGRVGLADKAAMFEYGTLIDKSQGEHLLYLSGYDI